MTRRRTRGFSIVLCSLLLAACTAGSSQHSSTATPAATSGPSASGTPSSAQKQDTPAQSPGSKRPNIVLLMTDDEALDDMWVMPKTRQLIGSGGATFDRAFSNYPLCCPARATVLTGQYAHNHGVMGNEAPWGGYTKYVDERDSLPVWLHAAGYRTAMLGKYLTGYPLKGHDTYVPPGWDDWRVPVDGTYNYEYRTVNVNGRLRKYHEYQAGYLADQADEVISQQAPGKPFFLWASFLAPHAGDPLDPDDTPVMGVQKRQTPYVEPRYRGSLSNVGLPRSPP